MRIIQAPNQRSGAQPRNANMVGFGPGQNDMRFQNVMPTQSRSAQNAERAINATPRPTFQGVQAQQDPRVQQGINQSQNLLNRASQVQGVQGPDFTSARSRYEQALNGLGGGPAVGNASVDTSRVKSQADKINTELSNRLDRAFDAIDVNDYSGVRNTINRSDSEFQTVRGADTDAARRQIMERLDAVNQGPDREAIASRNFQRLLEEMQPQFEQQVRDIGRSAAAFGRTGSGMTTNSLTDMFVANQRNLQRTKAQLADDTASQMLNDRMAQFQATQGAAGQLLDMDTNLEGRNATRANFTRDLGMIEADLLDRTRGQRVGERDFSAGRLDSDRNYQIQRAAALRDAGGLLSDASGQELQASVTNANNASAAGRDAFNARASALRDLAGAELDFARGEYDARVNNRDFELTRDRNIGNDMLEFADRTQTIGQRERDEARGENDRGLDFWDRLQGRNIDIFNTFNGRDERNRGELRDERNWQQQADDRAWSRENERMVVERLLNQDAFNNEQSIRDIIARIMGQSAGG